MTIQLRDENSTVIRASEVVAVRAVTDNNYIRAEMRHHTAPEPSAWGRLMDRIWPTKGEDLEDVWIRSGHIYSLKISFSNEVYVCAEYRTRENEWREDFTRLQEAMKGIST